MMKIESLFVAPGKPLEEQAALENYLSEMPYLGRFQISDNYFLF